MNSAGVPYGGIALTALVNLLGVELNVVVPEFPKKHSKSC